MDTIRAGGLVAVATETVYGLAADATRADAVAAIYAAKGRPSHNPLIVHVLSSDAARRIGVFDPVATRLADAFWPGPLTLVLPLAEGAGLAPAVTAGLSTVAVRVPAGPAIRALIEAVDRPLAAPSANRSGHISPTTADHVRRSLGPAAPIVLDDGPCPDGLESTIVACLGSAPRLLRPGSIPLRSLEEVAGMTIGAAAADGPVIAPGQLASHYAPSAPVILDWTGGPGPDRFVIGFGGVACDFDLSPSGDPAQAAARLYAALHAADQSGRPAIMVAPLDPAIVGPAILDRLHRAAADRS